MSRSKRTLVERQAALKARLADSPDPVVTPQSGRVAYFQEQHFGIPELSKLWGMSADSLRRIFQRELKGVIRVGQDKVTMFVAESAARRVYARLTQWR